MVVPSYTLTNERWEFQVLHSLTNIWCCHSFWFWLSSWVWTPPYFNPVFLSLTSVLLLGNLSSSPLLPWRKSGPLAFGKLYLFLAFGTEVMNTECKTKYINKQQSVVILTNYLTETWSLCWLPSHGEHTWSVHSAKPLLEFSSFIFFSDLVR